MIYAHRFVFACLSVTGLVLVAIPVVLALPGIVLILLAMKYIKVMGLRMSRGQIYER